MSFANIKTKLQAQEGFTIVELLIVIVVIAILAAITIVSYNGITARANSSSAQAAASSVLKKIEAYAADQNTTGYPLTSGALTTGTGVSSSPYYVTGVTMTIGAALTTAPTSPSVVQLFKCPSAAATSGAITGYQVKYWKYDAATPAWTAISTGDASGCGTTAV